MTVATSLVEATPNKPPKVVRRDRARNNYIVATVSKSNRCCNGHKLALADPTVSVANSIVMANTCTKDHVEARVRPSDSSIDRTYRSPSSGTWYTTWEYLARPKTVVVRRARLENRKYSAGTKLIRIAVRANNNSKVSEWTSATPRTNPSPNSSVKLSRAAVYTANTCNTLVAVPPGTPIAPRAEKNPSNAIVSKIVSMGEKPKIALAEWAAIRGNSKSIAILEANGRYKYRWSRCKSIVENPRIVMSKMSGRDPYHTWL